MELNFRFSGDEVSCYLMVCFGYNRGRNLILDHKSIVEHICDGQLPGLGVQHLNHININSHLPPFLPPPTSAETLV